MTTAISEGLRKAQETLRNTASKSKKLVDLETDTNTVNSDQFLTTDHGTKISNTDNWLRPVDGTRTGPALLEDQIAREKVWRSKSCDLLAYSNTLFRFIVLITNASLREWCMRVEQARLATSNSGKAWRT